MLVSTLIIAFIAALTIYLEREFIMSLVSYGYEVEMKTPSMNDILNINLSRTLPDLDEIVNLTEINWVPLQLNQNSILYNETTIDASVETTSLGLYTLVSGAAALCGIFLLNQYYLQPPPIQPHRNLSPPPLPRNHRRQHRNLSPSPLPGNHQRQQTEFERYAAEQFEQFERRQELDFRGLIQDLEQMQVSRPRRTRRPRSPHLRRSSSYSPPPPPYSPPPPAYSPPPPYSQVDPYPSPD